MPAAPIALFVYNRAEACRRVLQAIAGSDAPRLYIFADGPKPESEDVQRCREVRAVIENTAFRCDVEVSFSVTNMGSRARIRQGIEAVFAAEPAAIFVEDDCVLDDGFFPFANEMLEHYRDDPQIMMISGTNPLGRWRTDRADYLFSRLGNCHAWASWRRAWQRDDVSWSDQDTRARVRAFLDDDEQFADRARRYELIAAQPSSIWDYDWALKRQANHGLTIVPSVNLARHGGNDPLATHVKRTVAVDWISGLGTLPSPLRHPAEARADDLYDRMLFEMTGNRLSQASAEFLASRLIEEGQRLRAAAILLMASGLSAEEVAQRFPMLRELVKVRSDEPS